ncbi:MAG TPA: LacI family DNA-binding transcriptional regulator [Spirochaetia bacterium]|nr:LacI family DNA-binding transcriptional regulator [Spirochaetales bacterium]HRY79053.1 LacI family DNA-binding transcriptional regulator [Spirochaetia bacterium]
MPNQNATVKEIARLAGVSIGTVDRVLHGRDGVAEETRENVESIVRSLGYRPNVLARQLSLGKTWLFRVLAPKAGQDSGYWGLCLEGIRAAARDLSRFSVRTEVVEFDRYDPAGYRKLLSGTLAEGFDGLLLAPVLPAVIGPALAALPPGTPYAFFDAALEGADPVFSIGQDAYSAGRLAGRLLSLLAPGDVPLAAIDAHPEDGHIRRRVAGFESYLREAGSRRLIVRECPGFERPEVRARWFEDIFREEPGIGGLLVANSSGHLAGEWLAAAGKKDRCAVVSWDLVPRNAAALREGLVDCVISQRPREQGRLGLERLYRIVAHGDPGGTVAVATEILLKENMPAPEAVEERT